MKTQEIRIGNLRFKGTYKLEPEGTYESFNGLIHINWKQCHLWLLQIPKKGTNLWTRNYEWEEYDIKEHVEHIPNPYITAINNVDVIGNEPRLKVS